MTQPMWIAKIYDLSGRCLGTFPLYSSPQPGRKPVLGIEVEDMVFGEVARVQEDKTGITHVWVHPPKWEDIK